MVQSSSSSSSSGEQEPVTVPKTSVKSSVSPALSKQALETFERRFAAVRTKLGKASDIDASNVESVRKLSRYMSLYVQLNTKKATNETKRESTNILRKAFDTVKRAESEGDFQGKKLVGNSRFTEKGASRFAIKATKYLTKVYDRVDSAEVREDGTYDNSVFSVPEEGTSSQLDAPEKQAEADVPPPSQTQTAEQTAASLAGQGAGALPTAPVYQTESAEGIEVRTTKKVGRSTAFAMTDELPQAVTMKTRRDSPMVAKRTVRGSRRIWRKQHEHRLVMRALRLV